MRSSETGDEIGGVSLYLPDDGTDRGRPYFVYHDPLYALGIELPDGLTASVDTLVTSWPNNTTFEWDDVELTETGAETNVFTYNEGGLEITVTLDPGAAVTAEFDTFGATVYRSDSVTPARRTFFEETDEDTGEFASSIFGAQIVLVDGLTSSTADVMQVMLYSSTSSESYSFIAAETGVNTNRFVSEDGLWYIDLPSAFVPTASIDSAVITVFGPATSEPQQLAVAETGAETNVLVTLEYIDSADTDYPEPSDTTFHYVEVRRWPGICGDERTVTGVSGDEFSHVPAVFGPSGLYTTPKIMIIPEGYTAPEKSEWDTFVAVIQDSNVLRRQEVSSEVLKMETEEEFDETKEPFYLWITADTIPDFGDAERNSFVKICLSMKTNYEIDYPGEGIYTNGVDFVAQGRPFGSIEQQGGQNNIDDMKIVAEALNKHLGHNVVFDDLLTLTEFGACWVERIRHGIQTPIVHVCCHGFLTLVSPYDQGAYRGLSKYGVWREVIEAAQTKEHPVSALNVRMFVVSSCGAGGDTKKLTEWQEILQAYGVYGATTGKAVSFDRLVWSLLYEMHECNKNGYSRRIPGMRLRPNIDEVVEKINEELKKAYAKENGSFYIEINEYVRSESTRKDGPLHPLINGLVPNHNDWRNKNLDWVWWK